MENKIIKEIQNYSFAEILKLYPNAIKLKASNKKKLEEKNKLLELDQWMQKELGTLANSRKDTHITSQELVDLMKWKLLRGKWRPRLVQLAESNSPEKVREISTKSIVLAKKSEIEGAVKKMCELKGVGPATASAILSICVPNNCSFFADEVAQVFLQGKINYTLPEYMEMNSKILEIKSFLESEISSWTAHDVELTIWTYCVLKDDDPGLLKNIHKESISSPPLKKTKR